MVDAGLTLFIIMMFTAAVCDLLLRIIGSLRHLCCNHSRSRRNTAGEGWCWRGWCVRRRQHTDYESALLLLLSKKEREQRWIDGSLLRCSRTTRKQSQSCRRGCCSLSILLLLLLK